MRNNSKADFFKCMMFQRITLVEFIWVWVRASMDSVLEPLGGEGELKKSSGEHSQDITHTELKLQHTSRYVGVVDGVGE